jgi:hypothetical protein
MKPHPHAGEEWFERLPPARQVELAREHAERLQRPGELAALQRRRMRIEALQMGGVFALFGWICGGFLSALVCAAVGSALGWLCSRLDLTRLPTAALGMPAFFGAQFLLHGSVWTTLFAVFPLGAMCALIGWTREERGT